MKKLLSKIVVLLLIVFFLVSCDILGLGESDSDSGNLGKAEYGSLLISVKDFSKSIQPVKADLNIAKYKISATYKGTCSINGVETSFSAEFTGDTYTKNSMLTGSWDITIDGYDSQGIKIATYKKTVGIVKNEISTTSFEESGYITNTGKGSFKVSVQLPSGMADSIHVKISNILEYKINKTGTSGGLDIFENTTINIASSNNYMVTISVYKGSVFLTNLVNNENLIIYENLTSVYENKLESLKYNIIYKVLRSTDNRQKKSA